MTSAVSMSAALELLGEVPGKRKVAILGDMLELGLQSGEFHAAIGAEAAARADLLLATGSECKQLVAAARSAGMDEARHFERADQLGAYAAAHLESGDVALVKASRGMALDRIVDRILQ